MQFRLVILFLTLPSKSEHSRAPWAVSYDGHQGLLYYLNHCENITGYIPPVNLQCLAGEIKPKIVSQTLGWNLSQEVWSSTVVRRTKEHWRPLRGTRLFFFIGNTGNSTFPHNPEGGCISFCVFQIVWWLPALAGTKSGKTFGCIWVGCKNSTHIHTNRSFLYLRGHPQIPVGDVLTELPTKLDAESGERKRAKRKEKKEECKWFAHSTEDKLWDTQALKNLACPPLSFFSKQPNLDDVETAQGN